MKEVIWLAASRNGISKMTKNLPQLGRGEIPVKVTVNIADTAFGPPVLEQSLTIRDWREGIAIPDPEFRELTITEAEAEMIRRQRLTAMQTALEDLGYTVTAPEGVPGA